MHGLVPECTRSNGDPGGVLEGLERKLALSYLTISCSGRPDVIDHKGNIYSVHAVRC